jgi:hypothetical protein
MANDNDNVMPLVSRAPTKLSWQKQLTIVSVSALALLLFQQLSLPNCDAHYDLVSSSEWDTMCWEDKDSPGDACSNDEYSTPSGAVLDGQTLYAGTASQQEASVSRDDHSDCDADEDIGIDSNNHYATCTVSSHNICEHGWGGPPTCKNCMNDQVCGHGTCPDKRHSEGTCVCDAGYILDGDGVCTSCAPTHEYDSGKGCIPKSAETTSAPSSDPDPADVSGPSGTNMTVRIDVDISDSISETSATLVASKFFISSPQNTAQPSCSWTSCWDSDGNSAQAAYEDAQRFVCPNGGVKGMVHTGCSASGSNSASTFDNWRVMCCDRNVPKPRCSWSGCYDSDGTTADDAADDAKSLQCPLGSFQRRTRVGFCNRGGNDGSIDNYEIECCIPPPELGTTTCTWSDCQDSSGQDAASATADAWKMACPNGGVKSEIEVGQCSTGSGETHDNYRINCCTNDLLTTVACKWGDCKDKGSPDTVSDTFEHVTASVDDGSANNFAIGCSYADSQSGTVGTCDDNYQLEECTTSTTVASSGNVMYGLSPAIGTWSPCLDDSGDTFATAYASAMNAECDSDEMKTDISVGVCHEPAATLFNLKDNYRYKCAAASEIPTCAWSVCHSSHSGTTAATAAADAMSSTCPTGMILTQIETGCRQDVGSSADNYRYQCCHPLPTQDSQLEVCEWQKCTDSGGNTEQEVRREAKTAECPTGYINSGYELGCDKNSWRDLNDWDNYKLLCCPVNPVYAITCDATTTYDSSEDILAATVKCQDPDVFGDYDKGLLYSLEIMHGHSTVVHDFSTTSGPRSDFKHGMKFVNREPVDSSNPYGAHKCYSDPEHGYWTSASYCTFCNESWTGDSCNICKLLERCVHPTSASRKCDDDGKCICAPGWGGTDCVDCLKASENICKLAYVNDGDNACNDAGDCDCKPGFSGDDCGTCTPRVACTPGRVTEHACGET